MTQALQDAIDQVRLLPEDDQNRAAEVLFALARTSHPNEDEATRIAIAEGVAQAKNGERALQADVDSLLGEVWR